MSLKISQLPTATLPLASADIVPVVQGGVTKQTPRSSMQTLAGAQNEAPAVTLASASTVDIGAAAANTINISGTTTITALGTIADGATRRLIFQGILTLTHNATSLILPSAANITTAAGDTAEFVSLGAGNWKCLDYARASGAALISSGGGLTNLTEAKNTASPNNTIPVVSLSVTITEASGDFAIIPKVSGAIIAAIPNSLTSGGNKRGANAVDLQTTRTAADQVAASGNSAIVGGMNNRIAGGASNGFIGAGSSNVVSGDTATVAGGLSNTANGPYSSIPGGRNNTSSGQYSTAFGYTGTSSGQYSAVLGGDSGTASGEGAATIGGITCLASGLYAVASGAYATTRGIYAAWARSSGKFGTNGDCQDEQFNLFRSTSDATPAELTAGGTAPSATNKIILPNSSGYVFTGRVVARSNASGDSSAWKFEGLIKRGANAAATSLVAAVTPTLIAQDAGSSAWVVAVTADTTNGGLTITVTGVAATSIKWLAHIDTAEVVS